MTLPTELPQHLTIDCYAQELTQLCIELVRRNNRNTLIKSQVIELKRGKSPSHWIAVIQTGPRPEKQLDLLPG